MAALHFHSDLSSVTKIQHFSASSSHQRPNSSLPTAGRRGVMGRPMAGLQVTTERKQLKVKVDTESKQLKAAVEKKPELCTADELHYVDLPDSDWQLALWRYLPSPQAPQRNHPLLLLSGIGTNAIGYDLSPENSLARYMASQGYDTWTLELRGCGLSKLKKEAKSYSSQALLGKRFSQMREFSRNLMNVIERIEGSASPLLSGILSSGLKDTQKQLDYMARYNWDLDNHLQEDLPAAMEYIKSRSKSKDGKLFAIGHSMGGILLYATLARCYLEGKESGLASIVTLGASLDYTSSRSSLKMLLPLVDHARKLDVPAIPFGAMSSAQFPYHLPWLNTFISAQDTTLQSDVFEKLGKMLCTIPFNLISQLATAFQKNGLCDRDRNIFFKDHLRKNKVPILAVAGDQDSICPPEAVYETVKCIPKDLITYKVFGETGGPHYSHYDIVGSPLVKVVVCPSIVEFLNHHDAP